MHTTTNNHYYHYYVHYYYYCYHHHYIEVRSGTTDKPDPATDVYSFGRVLSYAVLGIINYMFTFIAMFTIIMTHY